MRAVVQRVKEAKLIIDGKEIGNIKKGVVVFVGFKKGDNDLNIDFIINKIVNLRIFEDSNGKMNLSPLELSLDLMVIPNFTLYGDCKKGYRPNFQMAMPPDEARILYENFVKKLKEKWKLKLVTGVFGAMMEIYLVNDGPVTIIIEK